MQSSIVSPFRTPTKIVLFGYERQSAQLDEAAAELRYANGENPLWECYRLTRVLTCVSIHTPDANVGTWGWFDQSDTHCTLAFGVFALSLTHHSHSTLLQDVPPGDLQAPARVFWKQKLSEKPYDRNILD